MPSNTTDIYVHNCRNCKKRKSLAQQIFPVYGNLASNIYLMNAYVIILDTLQKHLHVFTCWTAEGTT